MPFKRSSGEDNNSEIFLLFPTVHHCLDAYRSSGRGTGLQMEGTVICSVLRRCVRVRRTTVLISSLLWLRSLLINREQLLKGLRISWIRNCNLK